MSQSYEVIFENNRKWLEQKKQQYPDYFKELADGQNPEYLYIGCSDSRVAAEGMMGLEPGEVFVHRNVANLVHGLDLNAASAIEYAVSHLKVKHIIICGHYNCGGIKVACVQERYLLDGYPIVHGWVFDLRTGRLIDLNIDFKNILADIQKIYDLTDSEWVVNARKKAG